MVQQAGSPRVLIVGGGPVGMGLAIELGQRGIACTVIERHPVPQRIPKGQNLTQRTLEHFHFWGVEKALRAARTIPPEYGIGGLTAYGTLLGPYHYDWLQRDLVRPFYYTANERLPQYATEAVLRARVSELPSVRVLYGWNAVEVLVRQQAGITQTQSDHDRLMVLLVFRSPQLHGLLERYPGKSFYNVLHPDLDGYWKFLGRVDLGNTWFFHAPVPAGTTRDNFDFQGYLQASVGASFDVAFEHIGFWDLRFAIADSYRKGRVFVAGDAAHSHPPYGGYGINTGLEDARNLGWKLAAVLQGWGGEALLDTYDQERRPVFASTARDFIARSIENDRAFLRTYHPEQDRAAFEAAWMQRAQGAVGEVHSFEPHYEGSSLVVDSAALPGTPGGSAVGRHAFEVRPGHHLAPATLSDGRNVYELLGAGFTLLAWSADATSVRAFQDAAAQLGVPLQVITDRADGERQRHAAPLAVVRPDQFVAWVGTGGVSLDQARAILRQACASA